MPEQETTLRRAGLFLRSFLADPFTLAALAVHLLVGIAVRSVAWPEVTTPGYLWSRGMVLYRDVKFLHTPGLIASLALAFRVFGPRTWIVKSFAIAGPLVSHVFVLVHTRPLPTAKRALVSAFFVIAVLVSDGNAVWPTVFLSMLAIPIASSLTRGRWARAGLEIGLAILIKQTAAYVLFVVLAALAARRNVRALFRVALTSALPYAVAVVLFFFWGSAAEMVRWTLIVPFQVQEITAPGELFPIAMLVAAFLPTIAAAGIEARRECAADPSAGWLLAVGFGFALLCFPNFMLLQTVACLPCLAVGAARLMELRPARLSTLPALFLGTWTFSRAAILAAGGNFDGKVVFWNEEPSFNQLIAKIGQHPSAARVHSELWGNVLPRSQRLPPGRIWVHPWLRWYFAVENVRERVLRAASAPGTIWVGYRGALPGGEPVGPFAIRVVPRPGGSSSSRRTWPPL